MNEQNYYRVSIKGIVIDDMGRFLLAKEDNGMWEMIGGGLDHEEDHASCLKREIFEETGLEVTSVSKTPKYFLTTKRRGHDSYLANIIYEITLSSLDFTPSDECQELRFFTVEEAQKEKLFPNVEAFLTLFDPSLHVKP